MKQINNLEQALERLELLMKKADYNDTELKQYIIDLHQEQKELSKTVLKLRQAKNKTNTTSSMHSKLTDALREQ